MSRKDRSLKVENAGSENPSAENDGSENPSAENAGSENPSAENAGSENPSAEKKSNAGRKKGSVSINRRCAIVILSDTTQINEFASPSDMKKWVEVNVSGGMESMGNPTLFTTEGNRVVLFSGHPIFPRTEIKTIVKF